MRSDSDGSEQVAEAGTGAKADIARGDLRGGRRAGRRGPEFRTKAKDSKADVGNG